MIFCYDINENNYRKTLRNLRFKWNTNVQQKLLENLEIFTERVRFAEGCRKSF